MSRRYDRQFKEDAVKHLMSSGQSLAQVSQELGVSSWSLSRWKAKYLQQADKAAEGVGPKPSELEAENRRLRRELARVTEQREILKKAVVFFGQESQKDMRS